MRLFGIPTEDRAEEITEKISEGEWIFQDLKEGIKEKLSWQEAKEKFKELINEVRKWKSEMSTLTQYTVFIFVDDFENPRAVKVYDTSSLGCGTKLIPERWRLYREELQGEFNDS